MLSSPRDYSRLAPTHVPGGSSTAEAMIDCAPLGMAVLDMDGRIIRANPALRALIPLDPRASARLHDHVHPDEQALLTLAIVSLAAAPGLPSHVTVRLLGHDGKTIRVAAHLASLPGDAGLPGNVLLQVVTTDSRTIEGLAMREGRWNHALVNSGLGVWDHNFRTGDMFYSDTWKAIRGLAPHEESDPELHVWLQTVHPDDRDHVLKAIERQSSGEEDHYAFEYRERHKDGHWVWIECRGACVEWDAAGTPTRIVGTDIDITGRKAQEEKLASLSQRLELALTISQIGVFEADVEEKEAEWDDRLLAIYGLDGEAHTRPADDWLSMLHPEDAEASIDRIRTATPTQTAFTNAFRIIRKDGSVRHIRASAAPYTDSNGRKKFIGANWDATADVELHLELARAKTLAEARNTELEIAKARIEHNAMHDYLTGLPNRRYLDDVLEQQAAECARSGASIAIFHIDLDRFKQINDTLGHRAGDTMLQHAAEVLQRHVGTGSFVARIGGDEFVFVSRPEGSLRKLGNLADRIIRDLCKPVLYEGHSVRFGASIGIASSTGTDIDSKQLLLNADIALYRAKSRGRNRHEFFSLDIQNQIINTKRVSDEILSGLERDEFTPFYQPQFFAQSLDLAGVETLARWAHPTKGVLAPDAFLTVAEDLDVVSTIDGLILEKALKDHQRWIRAGLDVPKISVNVSSRRLNDPALMKKLKSLRIAPGTVSFELLESIFLDNCDDGVVDNLAHIRKLGIDIEIDDFGTGHASIVSLLKIGPQTLKIDRELVRLIPQSQEQRRLVGSIIEIGKSLNIKVVAEGVETRDHIRILQDLDCDILQGYALARPMPFADVEPFLRSQRWRPADVAITPAPATLRVINR